MEYNTSARGENLALKARHQQADLESRACIARLLEQPTDELDEPDVYRTVREIVRLKYLLDEDDMITEAFNGLGEISIAKALGKSREDVKGIDLEAKCNGTSSVMTKKILLTIFLNRELGITIEPDVAADSTNIGQLAHEAYVRLRNREANA